MCSSVILPSDLQVQLNCVLYSTVHHCTVLYNTVDYSTVQYSTQQLNHSDLASLVSSSPRNVENQNSPFALTAFRAGDVSLAEPLFGDLVNCNFTYSQS